MTASHPGTQPAHKGSSLGAPEEFLVTTLHGEGISQPFATLSAAQRALEKIRLIYPDAYITKIRGGPADQAS